MNDLSNNLLDFIKKSPSAFHAVEEIKKILIKEGFIPLNEGKPFELVKGKNYFVTRNQSSIIAFKVGSRLEDYSFSICASHSDCPSFKVKPKSELEGKGYTRIDVEPYLDRVENKEQWCIVGAASKEWAKKVFPNDKVNVAVEKLWNAILATSRMTLDPIQEWKNHNLDLRKRCEYLNSLNLKKLHYTASNGTDLTVGLIPEGIFCGGSEFALGSNIEFNPNIPSEEVFTSPKKGEAEGIVYASKPLSYQGELIEDFSVRFENGKAVEVHARKGEELLKQMITMDETAAYLGECALIPFDSPINNTGILFFNTLYDENASCHLALGMGFTNCIKDYEKYEKKELEDMGVNDSMIHVDFMIGTSDMKIVGITSDDQEVVIFENGNWAF